MNRVMEMNEKSEPTEFRMEKLRLAVRCVIDQTLMVHGDFEVHTDMMRNEMIASLTSFVLMMDGKREVEKSETLRVPRSWWDHIKHDLLRGRDRVDCPWWVRWLTREIAYDVHQRPVIVKHYRVCPHVSLPMPSDGLHLRWMAGMEAECTELS